MENIRTVLAAVGSSMDKVVKCTIFITDVSKFQEMNEVYRSYFTSDPFPARSTVEVSALAGAGMIFEIEAVALA